MALSSNQRKVYTYLNHRRGVWCDKHEIAAGTGLTTLQVLASLRGTNLDCILREQDGPYEKSPFKYKMPTEAEKAAAKA